MRYLAPPTGQYSTMLKTISGCATAKAATGAQPMQPPIDMRARNAEVIEQALALRDVMRPGHALDAAAGLSAFAAVEHDAGKMFRQMIEQLDLGVDALRRPGLDHGVEAAGRVHQDRRPGADDLVARRDAVDDRARHRQPLICRPARASAISAVKASSAALAVLT